MAPPNNQLLRFIDALKTDGWLEKGSYRFQKGTRIIVFDTSSWMELGTEQTPRIFDVPVPEIEPLDRTRWTLNLINHLFTTQEKLESKSSA